MRAFSENSVEWHQQTIQYDMMRDYRSVQHHTIRNEQLNIVLTCFQLDFRNTVASEEQESIWEEVGQPLEKRDKEMRKVAAKRAFVRPVKKY